MAEHVEYKLTLEDLLTGKLNSADHAAKALEGTIVEIGKQLIIMAGLFEGFEFVKDSYQEFEKIHQSELQLENTLRNVGERAGITGEQMVDMAKESARHIDFTVDSIISAESALSRYKNISKATFEQTIALSADLATINHESIDSTATMLGRILEAPAENLRLLRQLKISFTTDQKDLIKTLEETGHVAEAQQIIFKALADRGYEGAAAIAAQNDPLFAWREGLREVKEELGEMIYKMIVDLKPTLIDLIADFKIFIEWLDRNKTDIKYVTEAVLAMWAAMKGFALLTWIDEFEGIGLAGETAAGGIAAAGTAATAANAAILPLVATIGGLVVLYNQLTDAQEQNQKNRTKLEDIGARDAIEEADERYAIELRGEDKGNEKKALEDTKELVAMGYQRKLDEVMAHLGPDKDNEDALAMDRGLEVSFRSSLKALEGYKGPTKKAPLPGETPKIQPGKETKGVDGPKVININVTIGNLIDKFTIATTNVMDTTDQLKKHVARAIVDAVSDAEILVGQQH